MITSGQLDTWELMCTYALPTGTSTQAAYLNEAYHKAIPALIAEVRLRSVEGRRGAGTYKKKGSKWMNAFVEALNDAARNEAKGEVYGPGGIQSVIDDILKEYAQAVLAMIKEREE